MSRRAFCPYCAGHTPSDSKIIGSNSECQTTIFNFTYVDPVSKNGALSAVSIMAWQIEHIPTGLVAFVHRCRNRKRNQELQLMIRGAAPDTPDNIRQWEALIKKAVTLPDRFGDSLAIQGEPWLKETRGRKAEPDIYLKMYREVAMRLRGGMPTSKLQIQSSLDVSERQIETAYKKHGFKTWQDFVAYVKQTDLPRGTK